MRQFELWEVRHVKYYRFWMCNVLKLRSLETGKGPSDPSDRQHVSVDGSTWPYFQPHSSGTLSELAAMPPGIELLYEGATTPTSLLRRIILCLQRTQPASVEHLLCTDKNKQGSCCATHIWPCVKHTCYLDVHCCVNGGFSEEKKVPLLLMHQQFSGGITVGGRQTLDTSYVSNIPETTQLKLVMETTTFWKTS